jgi:malonyl-CoA O-methyltransferase
MVAEQHAMRARFPEMAGRDVLDVACGTGRYSMLAEQAGARLVLSIDYSRGMLARAQVARRIRADMCALPLRSASVDVVLSGLALGHAADLDLCMREIARVLRPGGVLLYSDFHPEATARGFRCPLTGTRLRHTGRPCMPPASRISRSRKYAPASN